jgi:hypothetical protein
MISGLLHAFRATDSQPTTSTIHQKSATHTPHNFKPSRYMYTLGLVQPPIDVLYLSRASPAMHHFLGTSTDSQPKPTSHPRRIFHNSNPPKWFPPCHPPSSTATRSEGHPPSSRHAPLEPSLQQLQWPPKCTWRGRASRPRSLFLDWYTRSMERCIVGDVRVARGL